VDAFNAANRWRKQGMAMTGVKYGISHGGLRASASVRVFQEDGSICINHYGCEVGQGISTKVRVSFAHGPGFEGRFTRVTMLGSSRGRFQKFSRERFIRLACLVCRGGFLKAEASPPVCPSLSAHAPRHFPPSPGGAGGGVQAGGAPRAHHLHAHHHGQDPQLDRHGGVLHLRDGRAGHAQRV
jgi:hypothetical protein